MVVRRLKEFFSSVERGGMPAGEAPDKKQDVESRIQLATCVLLLEVAHSDDHFSEEEQERIIGILKADFDLSDEYAAELIELAHVERKESIDMWGFTSVIDNNYSPAEKERVMESLWKVIYADERLDAWEDHIVHRLAKLLNLTHKQLIQAKVKVMGEK
jgi:uncharacterized tellurite resistance protein B-like protein